MILRTIITFFLATFICACGDSCREDAEFKKQYFNAVEILRLIHEEGAAVSFSNRAKSIESLETVIGYKSKVVSGNDAPFFFGSEKDYREEMALWKDWYESNKCRMTNVKALEMFQKKWETMPSYDDTVTMNRIKDTFPYEKRDSARYLDSLSYIEFRAGWPAIADSAMLNSTEY